MKLFKFLVLSFLFFFLITPIAVRALSSPVNYNSSSQTEQYYSVVFDQEQEASIVAKLTYFNQEKDEIKNLSLEIPGSTVRIVSIIQENHGKSGCLEYSNYTNTKSCIWSSGLTYTLLERNKTKDQQSDKSLKIEVPLKKTITSMNSSTIIVFYKTKGFTTKTWDGYKYAFETVKSPYDIDKVRVAIDVSDDLYIKKDAQGATNYQNDIRTASGRLNSSSFAASPILEEDSSSISTVSGVVKETTSLDPNENYKVEGKYYNNQYIGQLPMMAGIAATFLLIVIILVIIIRNEKKI